MRPARTRSSNCSQAGSHPAGAARLVRGGPPGYATCSFLNEERFYRRAILRPIQLHPVPMNSAGGTEDELKWRLPEIVAALAPDRRLLRRRVERKVMPKKVYAVKNRPTMFTLSQLNNLSRAIAAASQRWPCTCASQSGAGCRHPARLFSRTTFQIPSAMNETPLLNLITDFVNDFRQPAILWQALVIVGCLALSWLLVRQLRVFLLQRAEAAATPATPETLQRTDSFIRILTPVLAAMLLGIAQHFLAKFQSVNLLSIAIPCARRWRWFASVFTCCAAFCPPWRHQSHHVAAGKNLHGRGVGRHGPVHHWFVAGTAYLPGKHRRSAGTQ